MVDRQFPLLDAQDRSAVGSATRPCPIFTMLVTLVGGGAPSVSVVSAAPGHPDGAAPKRSPSDRGGAHTHRFSVNTGSPGGIEQGCWLLGRFASWDPSLPAFHPSGVIALGDATWASVRLT
jgi:hypothetical protein